MTLNTLTLLPSSSRRDDVHRFSTQFQTRKRNLRHSLLNCFLYFLSRENNAVPSLGPSKHFSNHPGMSDAEMQQNHPGGSGIDEAVVTGEEDEAVVSDAAAATASEGNQLSATDKDAAIEKVSEHTVRPPSIAVY